MRKVLKLILASALLCMAFTSNVLAEGSITAGNINVSTDGNDKFVVSDVIGTTGNSDVDNSILYVQNKTGSTGTKLSNLDAENKKMLGLTGFGDNAVITPFVDITPKSADPSGNVTISLSASLLSNASKVTVIHIKNGGVVEKLKGTIVGTDSVKFSTTSYSPFAFVIEYGNGGRPVVNTAANEVSHTNYMAYVTVAAVLAIGAIAVANKKLRKNVK